MGRNAAKELARIVATISAYVDKAAVDAALSLTHEGIERATGVSRGHLSRRGEPEILALVGRIAALKQQRHASVNDAVAGASAPLAADPVRPPVVIPGALGAMADDAIDVMVRRDLREITRLQQQWVARHARGEPEDAPLALHDADELLRRLRATVDRLRPTVAERTRRQSRDTSVEETGGPLSLSLEDPRSS